MRTIFAPDGSVKDAVFDAGYSQSSTKIAGTPRGDCVLEKFRALRIPPFEGPDTPVGKSLTLD